MNSMLSKQEREKLSAQDRHPMLADNDINRVLVNGASIALTKLKRAKTFDARLYYYAEIGVYLEVSLSIGAGITDDTRLQLEEMHSEATHFHMQKSKNFKLER
ncbi:excinuclease ABC subunit C [Motiliproteus sp. MSK22-1]|uniref:excinuclease ABC subunit C n=1 Tax=Motiliproteus sp. MSK22-1 TaxID=1897630 RepID=UPI000977CDE5|nr:excinuclease ABC subunit C [Motiliproteus sp. MSK22-1]OMH32691.1 excinuclease ABC subunit C [Motiliproteus sp. MSK22-1]